MVIRLAIAGAVLVVAGLVNVGGFGTLVRFVGVVALLGAGITWLVRTRNSSRRH
jgi:hypothetical protein